MKYHKDKNVLANEFKMLYYNIELANNFDHIKQQKNQSSFLEFLE
jgi:hypothetical protein